MMASLGKWSGPLTEAIEPVMVRIPEGWFGMGCETGRDDEKPVHRVWLDAFELAACQVTNAEYGRFLAATSGAPPPHWNDANFNDPQMPVIAVSWHEAASYCEWLSGITGKRYRLPSEAEWERAAARKACFILGEMRLRRRFPTTASVGRWGRSRWGFMRRMLTGCTTSATTSMNGAPTGMTTAITGAHRSEIRTGRRAAPARLRGAARGGIILR